MTSRCGSYQTVQAPFIAAKVLDALFPMPTAEHLWDTQYGISEALAATMLQLKEVHSRDLSLSRGRTLLTYAKFSHVDTPLKLAKDKQH